MLLHLAVHSFLSAERVIRALHDPRLRSSGVLSQLLQCAKNFHRTHQVRLQIVVLANELDHFSPDSFAARDSFDLELLALVFVIEALHLEYNFIPLDIVDRESICEKAKQINCAAIAGGFAACLEDLPIFDNHIQRDIEHFPFYEVNNFNMQLERIEQDVCSFHFFHELEAESINFK